MRLLLASDIHCDLNACAALVERAGEADAVLLAGDFARQHDGLERTIDALKPITTPTVLVPGNNERFEALVEACDGWGAATVLHGQSAPVGNLTIFGLGGGVPPIGIPWSFDLTENAARRALADCPKHVDILLVHSPPYGHVDLARNRHAGSRAILETLESRRPRLVVCGHIHDCWEQESRLGGAEGDIGRKADATTLIINAGPRGRTLDLKEAA
jgi:Icc-related predicted phosphoesterase